MKESLLIDGKPYISSRRAAEIAGYSNDYIGQLCRENKLLCRMVGRFWYINEQSILKHREESTKPNQTAFKASEFVAPKALSKGKRILGINLLHMGVISFVVFIALIVLAIPSLISRRLPFSSSGSSASVSDAVQMNDAAVNQSSGGAYTAEHGGLVVVPSAGSSSNDAKMEATVANSFSDTVEVKPDANGTTGVIKPEFRTVNGHDFLYVLVPVKSATSSTASPVSSSVPSSAK
jgi:hypothetical protein